MFRQLKAKRWVKKIVKKNQSQTQPIDCEKYIHPTDRITLAALKKIPLFDTLCSKVLSVLNEPQRNIIDMSSKVHITEDQLPRVYYMVQSICTKLGIDMPNIYLKLDREPNACTYGTEQISITINSGLLECLEDDELYAVLAHECGHIACKHVLYHTIGAFILDGSSMGLHKLENVLNKGLIGSIVTTAVDSALELAFYHWQRCSELSADRVAVMCCESAIPVIESMMRLAGGTTHIDSEIDRDLFIAQAEEYQRLTADNKINKGLEYWLTRGNTHPLIAVRAYEAKKWAATEEFSKAIQ